MKNIFGILILIIGLASCNAPKKVVAQDVKKEIQQNSYAAAQNALLWKVTGKELTKPSYVFGTIHMIGAEDFFLTDAMKSAFKASEKVVFEINMEDMNDMSVIFGLMSKLTMEDGKTLKDLMSDEDYKLVKDHFAELGLPLMFLEKMKPMFLSTFASGDMAPGDIQNGKLKSYEMEFMEMAKATKKEMAGLETIEFQLSMFDSIPYKAQADMLVEAIKSSDVGNDQFAEMVKLYKNQDLLGLTNMIQSDTEGIAEFEDVLLTGRNKNWIPLMEGMMPTKPTFFAVGAGHLGGKNGVVALLRKAGYKVTAVDPVKARP